mgnify:CR=1 FL=1
MSPRAPRLPRRSGRDRGREPVPGPVEGSVIRPAEAGDIATIIALRALMFESMGTASEDVLDTEWQRQASRWVQLRLSDPSVHIVVAEAHGTVVSCGMAQVVDLMPSPTRAGTGGLISNIATFPRHRELGFTHATFEALLDWFADETDVDVVSLNATDDVRSMYERFGFEESTFPELRLRLERPSEESDEDGADPGDASA